LIAQPEQVFRVVEGGRGAGFELEAEPPRIRRL
jgi:hypothetical protein